MRVQRLVYCVKPTKSHPSLLEWETAIAVLFVAADAPLDGIEKACEYLRSKYRQPIRLILHDPLSKRRVFAQGGDVLDAYLIAQEKGISCTFFPETFAPGKNRARI